MRAGLSTIQQTLTPEASAVLNRAIVEASRRRHGQTTPLHVAAALLSSPSGHLRQACIRSHPNPSSSHPLQCRALELCFSVALDRLPSASTEASPSPDESSTPPPPPISNALMAALKRAQAHQRRGCPESQQQPLLAVKVELEHLLLSILDDPSVSRVMREASFSSPAVKATIENSLSSPSPSPSPSPARSLYLSPRLVGAAAPPAVIAPCAAGGGRVGEIAKVFDILARTKKRNPILVGDADPGAVMREVIGKIATGDAPIGLRSVSVISAEKEFVLSTSDRTEIPSKIRELNPMIDSRIAAGGGTGIILDLGDLKWLVEGASQQQSMTDIGRSAVAEIGRQLVRFGGRLSLVGTATCATYLRCQVYFPTMESDWDLQAVPIAPRLAPLPGLAARVGGNAILSSKIESFGTPRGFPAMGVSGMTMRKPSESLDALSKNYMCNLCKESYERELARLGEDESNKSTEGAPNARKSLPRWLQIATTTSPNLQNQEQELTRKWRENCFRLHRSAMPKTSKPQINGFPLTKPIPINPTNLKLTLQTTTVLTTPERPPSPAGTLVKTDLALGPVQKPAATKFTGDATSIKRLVNGLLDKVSWQAEAASAVAAAVIQSNSGIGKRRNGSQKTDTWLLFAGPDRVGKQKMAVALSDLVFGATPLIIRLGSQEAASAEEPEDYNVSFRGRTSIDRVAEALRVNPFSTIFFEDFDQTDSALRGTIRRAMERGRLVDSRGREVGLGNAIFILTAGWLPEELGNSNDELRQSEEKITKLATSGRQLELQLEEKSNKRRNQWLFSDERLTKPRKDSLSLDLNLAAGAGNEEAGEGSLNSSDLTVEHGQEHGHGRLVKQSLATPIVNSSWTSELVELIDATIVFKPMDFTPIRTKVSDSVSAKFTQIMGEGWSIAIDDDALDQMTGGVWLGGDACNLFDEWTDRVFTPAVEQLRGNPKFDEGAIVRLSSVKSGGQLQKSYLPASVKLAVGDR